MNTRNRQRTQGISHEDLLKLGRHRDAERRARAILDIDPDHIGALETLAKVQWHLGEFKALLPTLERLLALNPYEPGYHALRGASHQALGHCGEAVLAFSRCAIGDSAEASHAREQITDLHAWERYLVGELLVSDPVFRADYAQDAQGACQRRGFQFVDEVSTSDSWVPSANVAAVWARPS